MARSIIVDKRRLEFDGQEIPGFKSIESVVLDQDTVEISEFDKIRNEPTGVEKVPVVNLVYNHRKDSITFDFFWTWFKDKSTKDVTEIQTDGAGAEIVRFNWSNVKCSKVERPAADSAGVEGATIPITLVPEDIDRQEVRT